MDLNSVPQDRLRTSLHKEVSAAPKSPRGLRARAGGQGRDGRGWAGSFTAPAHAAAATEAEKKTII